jgi:shikimate kinase
MRKLAVVLRGPIAVGKSTVANELLAHFNQCPGQLVNLDDGWANRPDESGRRYTRSGGERYRDLVGRAEEVLVLELAHGEPSLCQLRSEPGATLNPQEWADLLRLDGRQIKLFFLYAESNESERRLKKRGEFDFAFLRKSHELHATAAWRELPSRIGVEEYVIDTTNLSPREVAQQILSILPAGD